MAKMRIYQVAREIGVSSDEIRSILKRLGKDVKSNLSSIEGDLLETVRSALKKPKAAGLRPPGQTTGRKPILIPAPGKGPLRPAAAKPAAARPISPAPAGSSGADQPIRRPMPVRPAPGRPGTRLRPPATRPMGLRPSTTRPTGLHPPGARPSGARPFRAPGRRGGFRPYPARRGPKRRTGKRRVSSAPPAPPAPEAPPPDPSTFQDIILTEGISVKALAEKLERKSKDIIKTLIAQGILVTINQPLDDEVTLKVCHAFGFNPSFVSIEETIAQEESVETEDRGGEMIPRAPVVTMMGHVDHGKTSLLDAIRKTSVAEREHGGITQHIGAHRVKVGSREIVFLDTPGHEAFTRMRARGAQVTDIVVLVVAAEDGVMPQTIEAIHHARAAEVPTVVAINKIDKPGADPERVKKGLAEQNLLVEDWGGKVVCVPVSAKKGTGLDQLLEMILLSSDLLELKANPARLASGTVLEAKLDRARGPVATILIRQGTLRVGDAFIVGAENGKVRAILDDRGRRLQQAGPSNAVEVLGLEGVPEAGDLFQVLGEDRRAKVIGAFRQEKLRRERLRKSSRMSLDHLFEQIKEGSVKDLRIILKTDVQGSGEVLLKTLQDLSTEKVKVKVIHSATGAVNDSDVLLASASNAIIVGFNVRPERSAKILAEKEEVDIRLHTVIYNVTNEVKDAMLGLLEPTFEEVYLGRAEVRATFKVPKAGIVAGCAVTDGRILRTSQVRLLRDNVVIHEGRIASLRRFKEDAAEVRSGFECGIGLERFNDVKIGDIIEAFKVETVKAKEL
ncbi:MAG: translation initiation factor IF-2 [Acidobacteriota bacterium]